MKTYFILIAITLFYIKTYGSVNLDSTLAPTSKNAISIHFLGNMPISGINYHRKLFSKVSSKWHLSTNIGVAYFKNFNLTEPSFKRNFSLSHGFNLKYLPKNKIRPILGYTGLFSTIDFKDETSTKLKYYPAIFLGMGIRPDSKISINFILNMTYYKIASYKSYESLSIYNTNKHILGFLPGLFINVPLRKTRK